MVEHKDDHPFLFKVGFGLLAFSLLIIFIYVRFPYDMLKSKMEETLSQNLGSEITLGNIYPGLLGGFVVDGLKVNGVSVADKVRFSPRLFDLITGTMGFSYKVSFPSSGRGEGFMRMPPLKSKRLMEMYLNLDNVNMSGLAMFFPAQAKPTGNLTGEVEFKSPRESYDTATGFLRLNWKKGTLPLKFEDLPFDALNFETLVIDSRIEKGILYVEKADFTGEMSGNLKGSIHLSPEIKFSRMNVTGELNLPPAMKSLLGASGVRGNKFSLRGDLNMPRFRMMTPMGADMPMPVSAAPAPLPVKTQLQQNAPQQQEAVKPPEQIPQQETPRQMMDIRKQQENVPNQTGEQEGGLQ
jgi:type II secretion system protein N